MKHPGPLTIHMLKAPGDVRQCKGDGEWFNVHQEIICRGPNTRIGVHGTRPGFSLRFPKMRLRIKYLVRVELIAIHGAQTGD